MAFINTNRTGFKWDQSTGLIALAAAALCTIPTLGFLMAWHMQVDLATFTRFGVVPALLALAFCEMLLIRKSPLLFNRLTSGLIGGLVATVALDLVRIPASYLAKGAPDYVPMIGQYLLNETVGIAPSLTAMTVGYGFHYLLMGSLLGAAYSLVIGKGRWQWALAAGTVFGIGFAALPQFQMLTVATGFDLATASLILVSGFAFAGAALGATVQAIGRTTVNVLYTIWLQDADLVETAELTNTRRERVHH